MTLRTLTIDDVLKLEPCDGYDTREKLEPLFVGRESLTMIDVIELDIPWADRLWVLSLTLPDRMLRHFAADCAEHVAHLYVAKKGEWKPSDTLEVVRQYADGTTTDTKLTAARDAAWDARDAASATVWPVEAAAEAAARAIVRATAQAAAGAVEIAGDTEIEWQVERLRQRINKYT